MTSEDDVSGLSPVAALIGEWYDRHRRDLPWRGIEDAYRIWLSEIILQQTRVAQGMDYYLRFVTRYPTVAALAAATEDDVMKLWQGLGYYSRARNLLAAARQVMTEFGGVFPTDYARLIRLRGVGAYTAAAIASFSAGEAVAVVDGNVARVLARLFDIAVPIDDGTGQKLVQALADALLDRHRPGRHNQAMMEFGALQCVPASPDCTSCPVSFHCEAYRHTTVALRPVRRPRPTVAVRYLHYYIFLHDGHILVHRRCGRDIWQGLYEFVLVEGELPGGVDAGLDRLLTSSARRSVVGTTCLIARLEHRLTHRLLVTDFHVVETDRPLESTDFATAPPEGYRRVSLAEWDGMAVPRPVSAANEKLFTVGSERSENNP